MPTERQALYAWLDTQEDGDRKNARVIDKVIVALPLELTHQQRGELLHAFAEDMTRGRASWVAAIHDGPKDADNPHAHIIFRDRDIATGKRVMELSEKGSTERLRMAWEAHANKALEQAGHEARIDRRTLAAQGIDQEPQIHLGQAVRALDERGERPRSAAREIKRITKDGSKAVIIDYRKIDGGNTRLDENNARIHRNEVRLESFRWDARGGMVAEQRAAMKWIKAAMKREKSRDRQAISRPRRASDHHAAECAETQHTHEAGRTANIPTTPMQDGNQNPGRER
jgi:hypothetical protein